MRDYRTYAIRLERELHARKLSSTGWPTGR
jgi:hypothetical protein